MKKNNTVFETVIQSSSEMSKAWNSLFNAIESVEAKDGSKFDTSIQIPNIGLSIDDLNFQIVFLNEEIQKLASFSKEEILTVPPLSVSRLSSSLTKSTEGINSFITTLDGTINTIDNETFQGSKLNPNRQNRPDSVNFSEKLLSIVRSLDEAYIRLIQILTSLPKSRKKNIFPGIVQDVQNLSKEIKIKHAQTEKHSKEIEEVLKSSKSSNKSIQSIQSKITEIQTETESYRKKIEEYATGSKSSNDEISTYLNNARELQKKVENYKAEFEALQKSIDEKKKNLSDGTEKQNKLFNKLDEIEKEINSKNEKAKSMLSGATVAGLAASFGSTRDKLNEELKKSRTSFYISIAVLAVLALPMIFYIFPGLSWGGPAVDRSSANIGAVIGEVVARAVILLPGIWFVSFASKRHSSLFRLREHYEYKYNMAFSVEGFKQQAEDIAPAIAGTTFYELLTRNPADVMDGGKDTEDGRPPNPLLDKIIEYLKSKKN